jgi:LacI family transcriptional regulator
MTERVTIAQVAAEAGFSAMTVSNVLNDKPGASARTRQLVLETARRLGYVPNMAARGLKGGRTGLVGVVALDLTNQYALEVVRGIADELAEAEMEVLISATYQDAGRELERVGFLTNGLVDGVLLIAPVLEEATVNLLRTLGRPAVVIDPRRMDVDLPRVVVDNYNGTRAATEYLIGLGHRRIGYIGGDRDFDSATERRRGFTDAMQLSGLTVDQGLVSECDFSYAGGLRAAKELLAEKPPTALLAASDLIAFGAIDAARSLNLDVPGRLSVVGFDDLPQAAQSFPGLTTVRQPLHDMGAAAVRMLLAQIGDTPSSTDRVQLETSLVVRGSASSPAPAPVGATDPGRN